MSDKIDIEFNKNEDHNKQLVYELKTKHKKVSLGGGEKAAANPSISKK